MIKPELYHKTVGILFDAYFNDTLEHGSCHACAVGNLVAANSGIGFNDDRVWDDNSMPWWDDAIACGTGKIKAWSHDQALNQINSTGYSVKEVAQIEYAFESAPRGNSLEDWMFNGLVAVLDVLAKIHQVTDQDLLTTNNKRFKEQYERRATCEQR